MDGDNFCDNVIALLEKEGRSRRWLAKHSGLTYGSLNSLLFHRRIPRVDTALRISRALGVSLDFLVSYSPENSGVRLDYKPKKKIDQIYNRIRTHALSVLKNLDSLSDETQETNNSSKESTRAYVPQDEGVIENDGTFDLPRVIDFEGEKALEVRDYEDMAAGFPREVDEREVKMRKVPTALLPAQVLKNPDVYGVFTLRGESLYNMGFRDGNVILAHEAEDAENGDVVIAYLEEEDGCTFKRLEIVPREDGEGEDYYICWEDGSEKRRRMRFPQDRICGVYVKTLERGE